MSSSAVKPIEAKRYALYGRVSDEKQLAGREFDSLKSQEAFLRRWVADKGGTVFGIYRDTESGTKLEAREGLMRLLADAEARRFDMAVAYNLDRWSRDVEIHLLLKRIERDTGIRFISATQEFATSPEGELLEGQLAYINQYYSRVISAKVKLKNRLRVDRGEWRGGRRPYGYTSERGRLFVVPAEAAVVRQIFELYLECRSAVAVRNKLRALGIVNRQGKPWSNSTIEALLRNPIYVGKQRFKGEVFSGAHEAIIDLQTAEAAARLTPTRSRPDSRMERPYPLLGLLWCGHCGKSMTSHYVQKRGKKYARYRCTATFKTG